MTTENFYTVRSALLLLACLAPCVYFFIPRRPAKSTRYPPGPKQLPLLGNVFDIPSDFPWLAYHDLAQKHGDVIHLSAFGQHIVVLDSVEAVTDLLQQRAHIYSSRPHLPVLGDLVGWNMATSIIPYGSTWRKHRRVFHQYFHAHASRQFHAVQARHTTKLLLDLFDAPEQFRKYIRHWTGATIIQATYGFELPDGDDSLNTLVKSAVSTFDEVVISEEFLLDAVPLLKCLPPWFPGASFQVRAKKMRKLVEQYADVPFNTSKAMLEAGAVPASFATLALNELRESEGALEDEVIIKHTCATTYAAGSDTTASSLALFFAAMALYPDVQRKAQAELQTAVGSDRLPRFTDMDNLPFINAIIKEILRWQPVTCLGLAHTVTEDDMYKGFYIPRGAMVMGNAWAILHNEKYYPDPHAFSPERFMKNGALNTDVLDPAEFAFGFGRRQCPGKHFAQNSLFIAFATILTCFNIQPKQGDDGKPKPVDLRMGPKIISHPEEFECSITPHSNSMRQLVELSLEASA